MSHPILSNTDIRTGRVGVNREHLLCKNSHRLKSKEDNSRGKNQGNTVVRSGTLKRPLNGTIVTVPLPKYK